MRYRKLATDGDMTFGNGIGAFYVDIPEAVAQAVMTRLRMEQGEWFLDAKSGTPWLTEVLGERTDQSRDPVIRERVLGTLGVSEILEYGSALDRDTRAFSVGVTISTIYGAITVQEDF